MPQPRVPTNILKMRGADKVHPGRLKERENEPENKNPIGDPPSNLNELQSAAFNEIVKLAIDGVLGEADRLAVEQAAMLLVKCRGQHEIDGEIINPSAQEQNQFFRYLNQFGMTPADRSKISITKKKEKNPFDE